MFHFDNNMQFSVLVNNILAMKNCIARMPVGTRQETGDRRQETGDRRQKTREGNFSVFLRLARQKQGQSVAWALYCMRELVMVRSIFTRQYIGLIMMTDDSSRETNASDNRPRPMLEKETPNPARPKLA